MCWQEQGVDPDYRFSLANERTFLAWIRTALAILAGGVVVHQVGLDIGSPWVTKAFSGSLMVLAGALGVGAYMRWRSNEIAMRHSRSLPHSALVPILAVSLVVLGIASTAVITL